MAQRTLLIANPRSRGGATGRLLRALEARVRDALGPVEVAHTRGPRDAERIAREGARAGVERMLVAGGDGTLSEVVTGLLAADLAHRVEIGLLPLGTGGDLVRSLGVPRDLDAALRCITGGDARPMDAGRVRLVGPDGAEKVVGFANVASFGISGLTDELVNRATKAFGGTVSFLIGTVRATLQYRSEPVRVRVDGEFAFDGRIALVAGANGRFFGGGMQIAPDARVDDGLLDIVIVRDLSVPVLIRKLPRLYRGSHLSDSAVTHLRGRTLEAEAEPGRVLLDIDGEPLGSLPARIELLPGALRVLAPGGPALAAAPRAGRSPLTPPSSSPDPEPHP